MSRGDLKAARGRAVLGAGSPTQAFSIVDLDVATGTQDVLRRSADPDVDEGYLSRPQAIEFPTEGGLTAHAFFYPPRNRDFSGLSDETPPLLVVATVGPLGPPRRRWTWACSTGRAAASRCWT